MYFVRVWFPLNMLCLGLLMIKIRCLVICKSKVLLEYVVLRLLMIRVRCLMLMSLGPWQGYALEDSVYCGYLSYLYTNFRLVVS